MALRPSTEHSGSTRRIVPATNYARSWSCRWTVPSNGILTEKDFDLLCHVNCSYLSSPKPPTLLSLKRHAQSLTILIRNLSVSTADGIPDAANHPDAPEYRPDEALDWLNNLDEPYTTADASHYLPLWAIHNDVRDEPRPSLPLYHCPLASAQDLGPGAVSSGSRQGLRRPHMTHHGLVRHANECLEILDHELSAVGGLMSLLPADGDGDGAMAGAENTLLGQWLLHQRHLVVRMHDLEMSYGRALDALAGVAIRPLQMVEGMLAAGRAVGHPQDTYLLVNTADTVTKEIHRLLDEREAEMEEEERVHRERGVSGLMWRDMWDNENGKEGGVSRDLVVVDLVSRFYRIKDDGDRAPIFILPAIERHDGVVETLKMERQPKVVPVATNPRPTRVSEWERKYRERLDRMDGLERENRNLAKERDALKRKIERLDLGLD